MTSSCGQFADCATGVLFLDAGEPTLENFFELVYGVLGDPRFVETQEFEHVRDVRTEFVVASVVVVGGSKS